MAAFLYEGVLLFGVVAVTAWIYAVTVGQRHGLHGRHGLMATLFLTMGLYAIWFWSHGGQTLAMKTWYLRLVGQDGRPPSLQRLAARYVLSWLWLAPPLLLAWLAQGQQIKLGVAVAIVPVWIAIYALLSLLLPQRQFLHDVISRTRVIDTRS